MTDRISQLRSEQSARKSNGGFLHVPYGFSDEAESVITELLDIATELRDSLNLVRNRNNRKEVT